MLARFLKERYFCPLFEAVKLLLPTGLRGPRVARIPAQSGLPEEEVPSLSGEEGRSSPFCATKNVDGAQKAADALGFFRKRPIIRPAGLRGLPSGKATATARRMGDATLRMVRPDGGRRRTRQMDRQAAGVYDLLMQRAEALRSKELCYFTGVTSKRWLTRWSKGTGGIL